MAVRVDGVRSMGKLLEAASKVFAQKGYRETTVAEICKRAGCNVSAINYHFKSKDDLYVAVWKKAFNESLKVYPLDGGLPEHASAEKKLFAIIYSTLHKTLDEGRLGRSGQILLREMAEPTEAIGPILHETIEPLRKHVRHVIGQLLGPGATEDDVDMCELSVLNQCMALSFGKAHGKLPPVFKTNRLTSDMIDKLVNHITEFSIAGIKAIRNRSLRRD
jgi:TetR/AcrR family transcriptional regulator, regulator of cefoperazone and chloramphenicol sensitivity